MAQTFIDYSLLRSFDAGVFGNRRPFPWENLHGFLTPQGFRTLYNDFPSLELFEYHNNIRRDHGQRPHNRYYLAYENSIYHKNGESGVVRNSQLPGAWQHFMNELETSDQYHSFVCGALGIPDFKARYAWHVGTKGSEVSPHIDAKKKLGTHILYFNTSGEWDTMWGGATLVLGDKQTDAMNPDFSDFKTIEAACIVDNQSFLFKNTPTAWHGVTALTCPEDSYRRLFNVIFEAPPSVGRRLIDSARGLLKTR